MELDIEQIINIAKPIFAAHGEVKLAYLFGSQANGTAGPLSDFDFAVYLDVKDKDKSFDVKLKLINELVKAFNTDKVDVVALDSVERPELKYNIISEGRLIYEVEPFRVIAEPRILNEYFDFYLMLKRHGLTNA